MTTYDATGVITKGRLKVRRWNAFEKAMRSFRDGEVIVTVTRATATRSEQQNRWYFGAVLKTLSEHTGHSVMELHEYCKLRFNPNPLVIVDAHGEVKDEQAVGGTTTTLNKVTFGDYLNAIVKWAAEDLHVEIPPADPHWQDRETAA